MSNEKKIFVLKDKRDKINLVSPSFCTAKWLQTTLYLQNGYNHSCHHPSPHKIPVDEVLADPAALHNSQHKKKQREMMLAGERPAECDYCWKIEDLDKITNEWWRGSNTSAPTITLKELQEMWDKLEDSGIPMSISSPGLELDSHS